MSLIRTASSGTFRPPRRCRSARYQRPHGDLKFTDEKPLSNIDFESIARRTVGFVGADLENLMNEAAILAARRNKKKINMREVEESIEKVAMGPERKSKALSKEEKRITAYHEVGHALVAHLLPECDPVHKVSIVSRGMALGVTWFVPEEDKHLRSKIKFQSSLPLLGGYVAEEIIFGPEYITTGASNDLEKATAIARRMVSSWHERFGPVIYGDQTRRSFWPRFRPCRNYPKSRLEDRSRNSEFIHAAYEKRKSW